jgi:hypothetical protein
MTILHGAQSYILKAPHEMLSCDWLSLIKALNRSIPISQQMLLKIHLHVGPWIVLF